MIVPTPIPFSEIPTAGVFSADLVTYFMKYTPSDAINLATAALTPAIPPSAVFTYFAAASLHLG